MFLLVDFSNAPVAHTPNIFMIMIFAKTEFFFQSSRNNSTSFLLVRTIRIIVSLFRYILFVINNFRIQTWEKKDIKKIHVI